jgi:muconolactone delta-isomerase
MKYIVAWNERPQGSAIEYENAQKRILSTFQHWEMPKALDVKHFFVRVGDMGGYMLVETDDPSALITFATAFPAFSFKVDTVIDIGDAVAAELQAIAWRDGISSKAAA